MRGWFDAFRHDGGPTLYDRANRTAVTGDVPTITICVVSITLFVAFLIIFPGIRKERFTTFTSVTLSLFVGAAILVGSYGSEWHTAEQQITSAYRAFSSEKIVANLGVHIGFGHVNVSLRSVSSLNASDRIDYNERFNWLKPDDMIDAYDEALHRGLPYPILTVAEYLSLNEEGFGWGRAYRSAGYFSCIALWSAFASWLLMNILLMVVPRYGAYMMILTGGLMLLTNLLYYLMIPSRPLVIRFEDVMITFSFGWCFWLVLAAGCLCALMGSVVALVEMAYPHKFSTIMELDYDTPYDRHIIIEESKDIKHKRPRLEEPGGNNTFGSRIFRRLSKRMSNNPSGNNSHMSYGRNGQSAAQDLHHASSNSSESGSKFGLDNPSMELDPPKSPWRYPHRTFSAAQQQQQQQRPSSRSESRKSTKSVNFREVSVYGNTLHPSSAAIPPSTSIMNEDEMVEVIPDVHTPSTSSEGGSKAEPPWDLDSASSSSSSDLEEDEELERVQDIPISSVLNFQNQLRSSASRQNSNNDWNEPDVLVVKQPLHKTQSAQSGHGTSKKSHHEDTDSANAIQLDRTGSRRSALATVSARISAAVDADRSSRHSSDDQATRVDMW